MWGGPSDPPSWGAPSGPLATAALKACTTFACDRAAQRGSQLLSGAMQPRANRVRGQLAGGSDFVIRQARGLAHQEDVAIEIGQGRQRLAQRRAELLRGGAAGVRF